MALIIDILAMELATRASHWLRGVKRPRGEHDITEIRARHRARHLKELREAQELRRDRE